MSLFDKPQAQELSLYDYQHQNIDALREGFKQNKRQVFYSPCGAGKTEMSIFLMRLVDEKDKKVIFLCDRRILVMQTSARMDRYGIPHGIIMAGMERNYHLNIQVASMQTIEAMGSFPAADMFIYDEAHQMRKKIIDYIQSNNIRLLGLSGSPHTSGMGKVYSKVTGLTTMKQLVEDYKKLVPLRVFVCQEIDMQGAKKIGGEYSEKEVTERGVKITGCVVTEWHKKTKEIYGELRKTIVFCAGTAHGINLEENFQSAGFNFRAISYKNTEEYKAEVLAEFAKPDSKITGVISCEILVKGFDVPDVHVVVDARPLSKSFSSHVQKLGRGMRGYPGKEYCTYIDHAGNYLRFKDQWDELYENGVMELDDDAEKTKAEPTKEQKEAAKCPSCGILWDHPGDTCTNCGHTRKRRNEVLTVAGEMVEVETKAVKEKYTAEYKEHFYQQLLGYCRRHSKADGKAYHDYIAKFGIVPAWKKVAVEPGPEVLNFIRSRNIAYAKAKR